MPHRSRGQWARFGLWAAALALLAAALLIVSGRAALPAAAPSPAHQTTAQPASAAATPEPVALPQGYAAARAQNDDVFGWLTVPGTNIDAPVLQHPTMDDFYLTHDASGAYNSRGSIYSEATYNARGFSDRVTVLYGHNLWKPGLGFYQLHKFEDADFFAGHRTLATYTDTACQTWVVLAAYTVGDEHILYTYGGFQDEKVLRGYLAKIPALAGETAVQDGTEFTEPPAGARYLLLSTCNHVSQEQRFLILCRLDSEQPAA